MNIRGRKISPEVSQSRRRISLSGCITIKWQLPGYLLLLFILFSGNLFPDSVGVKAKSYILKGIKSGKVHLQKSPEMLHPMASLTKLGTALLVSETLPSDFYIKVTSEIPITNSYESRAELRADEEYRVGDLYYGLLLPSGNDVARLFAKELERRGVPFSVLAEKWRADNLLGDYIFEEPVGLSSNSRASATGMIKILDKIRQSKILFDVVQTKEYTLSSKLNHKTKVLSRTPIHEVGGVKIFGKTGRTKSAGLCFAGFLQKEDTLFQIVLLGSEDLEGELTFFSEYLRKNKLE